MARLGLGPAWKCLRACDIDPKKCSTYRLNFPENTLFEGSVKNVRVHGSPKADLAWASFPCQDTSLAGGYSGLAGERSGTFWDWWRIVEGMKNAGKPYDILCIENVRGLLTTNNGTDFTRICEAIAKAGYTFGALVIDAALFLPHSRERLFIIAFRDDKSLLSASRKTPNPLWHPQSMQNAHDNLSAKAQEKWVWINPQMPKIKRRSLAKIITDNPSGVPWHTEEETSRLIAMMSDEHLGKLEEQKKKNRRVVGMVYKRMRNGQQQAEVRFDGMAGCLRTAKGGSSRQTALIVKGRNIRSRLLSPREAASLMGLPETYKLPDNYTDAYNLCGDGVAVPVVRFIARTILEPLLKKMATSESRLGYKAHG